MVVFCTLCYPYGQGTAAAFDLAPMADCQAGSYVPVEVRLHELVGPRELLLAIYLPVRGLGFVPCSSAGHLFCAPIPCSPR